MTSKRLPILFHDADGLPQQADAARIIYDGNKEMNIDLDSGMPAHRSKLNFFGTRITEVKPETTDDQ